MKKHMTFTLDSETEERLRQYAYEQGETMSHVIRDLIWSARVKNAQIRGQIRMDLDGNSGKRANR